MILVSIFRMQLTGDGIAPEIIRKGVARLTQGVQLGAALGDEGVLILVCHHLALVSARRLSGQWTQERHRQTGPRESMSQPALQAGFDERVQITVQHRLGVACLDAGAQILDA